MSPIRYRLLLTLVALTAGAAGSVADDASKLSFGKGKANGTTLGFGKGTRESTGSNRRASERDRDYARGLMKKYDANEDRVLQKEEWSQISGSPEKADANRDGRITYDELVARVMSRRREREATAAEPENDRRSYRLITAAEKLPDGLPSWFGQRDANGDGQVAMHEYSRRWTDSTARRFIGLDKNDDGLITADEAR